MNFAPQEIQTGDVLLFSGRSWWSRVIRARTRSRWSHVGIAVRLLTPLSITTRCFVIEALEGAGVRVVPFESWQQWDGEIQRLSPSLNAERRLDMVRFALQHWGCPYSSPLQFVRSFGLLTTWICRKLRLTRVDLERRRFFCSELVAGALHAAGCKLPKPPAAMSPADVAEFLQA